jgi:hypothetical protein
MNVLESFAALIDALLIMNRKTPLRLILHEILSVEPLTRYMRCSVEDTKLGSRRWPGWIYPKNYDSSLCTISGWI